jgi:hypothetical protein
MTKSNASTRKEYQAFGSMDDDKDHNLDEMKTNTITQENVVARDQMSVGELRQWLAQFGDKQKDHYSKGHVQKLPQSYSIQERIQQAEARLCTTTSPRATSSSTDVPLATTKPKEPHHDSTRTALTPKAISYHDSTEPTLTPKTAEPKVSYHDSTQPTLTPKTTEANRSYHESIKLASSPLFRTFENYKNTNQAEDSPLTLDSKALEDYRIVSIQKLLEPPQPQPGRQSFSPPWDDFDDFSEPGFNNSWHPNVRQRSLVDGWSDHEDQEKDAVSVASGNFTDPGIDSLSRKLARRLKKASKRRGGTNKKKATQSFRRKLPFFLCKPVKDNAPEPFRSARAPTLFEMAVASASASSSAGAALPPARPEMTETTARSESSPTTHMHNASLFQGKTLTSNTLDLLCGSDHLEQSKYHHTSISDGETVSTWSEDSGQPSIAPGAIDARLGAVFAEENEFENGKIMSARAANRQATRSLERKDDPRLERPLVAMKRHTSAGSYSTTAQVSEYKPAREAAPVTAVVQRFGGAARKTSIQRRKEELEKNWAADRAPSSHVKKVKWQVCQRSGAYQKHLVFDHDKV